MEEKICQSCAMPMSSKDQFGHEKNGSINEDYCCYCYQEGHFTDDMQHVEEMIESCVPFMVEAGMIESEAKKSLENILPKLKRWK